MTRSHLGLRKLGMRVGGAPRRGRSDVLDCPGPGTVPTVCSVWLSPADGGLGGTWQGSKVWLLALELPSALLTVCASWFRVPTRGHARACVRMWLLYLYSSQCPGCRILPRAPPNLKSSCFQTFLLLYPHLKTPAGFLFILSFSNFHSPYHSCN